MNTTQQVNQANEFNLFISNFFSGYFILHIVGSMYRCKRNPIDWHQFYKGELFIFQSFTFFIIMFQIPIFFFYKPMENNTKRYFIRGKSIVLPLLIFMSGIALVYLGLTGLTNTEDNPIEYKQRAILIKFGLLLYLIGYFSFVMISKYKITDKIENSDFKSNFSIIKNQFGFFMFMLIYWMIRSHRPNACLFFN